jgi:hypothetical protein
MQRYTVCFGWYPHPSSGAQTTVSTAPGTCHAVTATCRYRGRVGTVVCALDNGWRYHPKHVEQFPDIINCVTFNVSGSVHRNNILIDIQHDATLHAIVEELKLRSNSFTIAAGSSNGVTDTRCCRYSCMRS